MIQKSPMKANPKKFQYMILGEIPRQHILFNINEKR